MNKPTHTPAPWSFVQGDTGDSPTWNVRIGSSIVHLPGAFDMGVMDANARLIASAPDLLEALKEAKVALGLMLSYHGQCSSDYADVAQVRADDAMHIVDSAIQKATQP